MAEGPEVHFCIRPKDRGTSHESAHRMARALDEALTDLVPGGVGDYNHERGCVEVWLFERERVGLDGEKPKKAYYFVQEGDLTRFASGSELPELVP